MVHQESNYVYRPPVKSEVLVSPSGPLPGCFRGVDMGCLPWLLLLPLEEKRFKLTSEFVIALCKANNLLISQAVNPCGYRWVLPQPVKFPFLS